MGGMKKLSPTYQINKVLGRSYKTILDPANFAGKRPGGVNWSDAVDPGGKLIEEATGSNIGRKLADPGKLYSTGKVDELPETILSYQEKRDQRRKKESVLADAQRRRRMANKTILTGYEEGL